MPGLMMSGLATQRAYQFPDGAIWHVCNDYWQVTCRDCNAIEYCRMTTIERHNAGRVGRERHLNFTDSLPALQELLVTYEPYDGLPEHGVCERAREGRWLLVRNDEVLAEQIG